LPDPFRRIFSFSIAHLLRAWPTSKSLANVHSFSSLLTPLRDLQPSHVHFRLRAILGDGQLLPDPFRCRAILDVEFSVVRYFSIAHLLRAWHTSTSLAHLHSFSSSLTPLRDLHATGRECCKLEVMPEFITSTSSIWLLVMLDDLPW
jgi:hypothetical protein